MFHAGETIGPFRLEALCGRGRFAEVWRAVRLDRAVAAPVALKIPFDQDEPEKLLNEARQLLDLSHPNIVQVVEADVYNGTTCAIALEYFPEGSLFDRLQCGERLSVEEAVRWTCDVLAGVQHAHDRNVLHCDLKPANVFVRHGVAKVGDFGIARLLGLHSHTQFLGGTVAYAAPERFQKKTGKPSEVWSVGVMLYEMLAGGRPFVGDDETELLAAILQEEPPPLRSLNPDVPAWLEAVVHTALSKEVAARFASAGAMREALQHSTLASAGPLRSVWPLPAPAAPVGTAREEEVEFSTEPASSPLPRPVLAPIPRRPQHGGRLRRLLKFWPPARAAAAPPTQAQRGDLWTNPKDHAKMVFIPAGEFVMGTTPAQAEELLRGFPDWKREGFANEQPAHVVYLDSYWIDKTEVTNAQFARFVRETGYKAEGGWQEENGEEQHPAVKVSWNDAVAYAQWAGKRLPTEAEWEKAARGEEGRAWPWGNVWDETRCNFRGRADGYSGTAPVSSFPQGASPYGCLNMAGNVWEWCADWYEADYYGNSPERNPAGPATGEKRVLRGGSWIISYPNFVRCAYRYSFDPRLGHGSYGFRCVKDPAGAMREARPRGAPAPAPVPRPPQASGEPRRLRAGVRFVLPAGLLFALVTVLWVMSSWLFPRAYDSPRSSAARPPAQARRGDTWTNPRDQAAMVFIPAGEFLRGSTVAEALAEEDEKPPHRVYLDAYWIDQTEVTNAQFARFVRETGYKVQGGWREEPGKGQYPAVHVTWNDAAAYARWAGERLPTEAEWEKAARGGDGRRWPWGNTWDARKCNSYHDADGYRGLAPVGCFPEGASPYGCLDLAGNVWEWCADWYGESYYGNAPPRNPRGPVAGRQRVLRGGSCYCIGPNNVRCAYRDRSDPRSQGGRVGFRCATTPP